MKLNNNSRLTMAAVVIVTAMTTSAVAQTPFTREKRYPFTSRG
jgi:hypothetical protein